MFKGRIGVTELDSVKGSDDTLMLKKSRKVRKDKRVRIQTPICQESHVLLKRLALACDVQKTTLMTKIVEAALRNPAFFNWLQDEYRAKEFRVVPSIVDGKMIYVAPNE